MKHCMAELDLGLPAPLVAVGQWLRQVEGVLAEEGDDLTDHAQAAKNARDKQGLLKVSPNFLTLPLLSFRIIKCSRSPNLSSA